MLSCSEFLAEFGDYLDEVASPDVRAVYPVPRARRHSAGDEVG